MHDTKLKTQSGFSLIELTIVLTIAGLLIAGAANLFHAYLMAEREDVQEDRISDIQSAFIEFFTQDPNPDDGIADEQQRYPCPADPALAPGEVGHGVEQRDGVVGCLETGEIKRVAGAGGGSDVYIGSVPFATLGISSEMALDAYHNQLTYAITEELTLSDALLADPLPAGQIDVAQETSPGGPVNVTRQPFAVVSHGLSGAGAFTAQGNASGTVCGSDPDARDVENCDRDDADFVSFFRSEGDNNEFYDDEIVFSLIGAASEFADQLWAISPADTDNIFNRNTTGNVGVGTDDPQAKLDVAGPVKIGTAADGDCIVNTSGATRYNATDDNMEYCAADDGTGSPGWLPFGGKNAPSTVCAKEGNPVTVGAHNAGACFYKWTNSDCSNGTPSSSDCVGVMIKAAQAGRDEDWMVHQPGESHLAETFADGGMSWSNLNGCGATNLLIKAAYFCGEAPVVEGGGGGGGEPEPAADCAATSLSWSSGGQTCSATAPASIHLQSRSINDPHQDCVSPGGSATFQCNDGTWNFLGGSCTFGCGALCFTADTMVLMVDGSEKAIQDIVVGDVVIGQDGAENEVLELFQPVKQPGHILYAINDDNHFVTADHPFMTLEGWKSMDPALTAVSSPHLDVGKLSVGDTIITKDGTVEVASISDEAITEETTTYNFRLSGNGTYYADGYLVSDYQGRGHHEDIAE